VENVQTGIVHIGVGGFHCAHEVMYVDRITPASTNDDIATLKAQGVEDTLLFMH
jgi:mannitol-1-phosphate/altronate dehydrogenase